MVIIIILIIIALILYKLYTIDCDRNEHMETIPIANNESSCAISSVYNNGQLTVNNATVTDMLTVSSFNLLPTGVIAAWNGTSIPNGWLLCDGTNGTPDLRNRFIIGTTNATDAKYAIGATGGNSSVTLSIANMPPHTHSYSLANKTNDALTNVTGAGKDRSNFVNGTNNANTGSAGGNITGKVDPFSIMPPYYALIYIMKS